MKYGGKRKKKMEANPVTVKILKNSGQDSVCGKNYL